VRVWFVQAKTWIPAKTTPPTPEKGALMVSDAQQAPVIEARGLTKVFRDFWGRPKARAVNDVDFTVERGQVFGLLGPNGSGKSTTVKMLLGLLYPTRGKLTVLGESPRRVEVKRRIGYLPEESYLYRYLTAMETLDFFGSLFGIPAAERRHRCEQLLEMVGLTSARNRTVGEFSKGMARRIGLAQALINDPELVILDEPTAGLDPIGCSEVKDVLRLLAGRGKTVILCSHLLADVEDVCDHVIVLYGGKVCAQGGLRQMLQIEDKTRIVTPKLDSNTLEEVLKTLRAHLADDVLQVDHPSMNLEQFFLDVVRRAREASLETSGAQSGGRIAEYLRAGAEPAGTEESRRQVLTALAGTVAKPAEESREEEEVAATNREREEREAASQRLAQLVEAAAEPEEKEAAAAATPPAIPSRAGGQTQDLQKASKKLEKLLGETPPEDDRK
jgi:ABC-2 type transport system ATP-binding protein